MTIRKNIISIPVAAGILLGCSSKHLAEPDNRIITEWNNIAYRIAYQYDQFYSFTGVRAMALTHIAMHDALNAIKPRYEPYSFKGNAPEANEIAALSQAAFEILSALYPQRRDTLALALAGWLATVKKDDAMQAGIQLGKKSAASILTLRRNDGYDANGKYVAAIKPGTYYYTPGHDRVWIPDLTLNRPFTLTSPEQFRAPPPPALTSKEYADAYNEVKAYGCTRSQARNQDQTDYAHWWAEFGEHAWNRIGRITATQRALPLRETARMFALINMNLYDLYLSSFESKYYYNTWRPYTAIRAGHLDDNPATLPDTSWVPEMETPPWPDYPSTHAGVGAGGAAIVTHVCGTSNIAFTMESVMALPDSKFRTYHNLDSAAHDCAESRIMNGFHFRFATEAGKKQGLEVAEHIIQHYLRPLHSTR